jgi:hypothetical protein
VKEGRGIKTGDIKGSFFVRPLVNGVQKRTSLEAETFAAARLDADKLEKELAAPSLPQDLRDALDRGGNLGSLCSALPGS